MNTVKQSKTMVSIAVSVIAVITLGYSQHAHTCGLEPHINGGITISYPGSIDVAVAVANARAKGLLPPASTDVIPNDVRLQNMLSDLRRLENRLNKARTKIPDDSPAPFSLVLVGPGLWSHFHITTDGVLPHYHTAGPIAGSAVVLTHEAALHAMLAGSLSIERATELGLIAYAGADTSALQRTFEISLYKG
jgi:hypothetical protein